MQEAINDIYIYDSYIYCSYNDYIDTLFTDLTLHKMDLGKYTSIRPLYADKANDAEATKYLVGSYYLDKDSGRERYDILTSDFKPISTVLSRVGNLKKDRIPIIKGQSLGIIDLKGNWVLKYNKADFINAD